MSGDGRLSVSCLLNRQASKGGELNVGYRVKITDSSRTLRSYS
jgi:hypothetical protein